MKTYTIYNFGKRITEEQVQQIEKALGGAVNIVPSKIILDEDTPYLDQVEWLVDELDISRVDWEDGRVLIALPTYNYFVATLLAVLFSRFGSFPRILQFAPAIGTWPVRYNFVGVLDLGGGEGEIARVGGSECEEGS